MSMSIAWHLHAWGRHGFKTEGLQNQSEITEDRWMFVVSGMIFPSLHTGSWEKEFRKQAPCLVPKCPVPRSHLPYFERASLGSCWPSIGPLGALASSRPCWGFGFQGFSGLGFRV